MFVKQQNWLCNRLSKTLSRRLHKLFLDIDIDDVSASVHIMLSLHQVIEVEYKFSYASKREREKERESEDPFAVGRPSGDWCLWKYSTNCWSVLSALLLTFCYISCNWS